MRGLQRKRDPTRMACSMAEVVQRRGFLQAGKAEQTERRKVSSEPKSELGGQETVPPEELQEVLWKQFFADTSQWWDYRRSKRTPLHPDFKHKVSKTPLWLNNWLKPHWVDYQLATMDASWTARTESGVHTGAARLLRTPRCLLPST